MERGVYGFSSEGKEGYLKWAVRISDRIFVVRSDRKRKKCMKR